MKTFFPTNKASKPMQKGIALSILLGLACVSPAAAQENVQNAVSTPSVYSNPMFIGLLSVIILLLIVIYVFAEMLKAAAQFRKEKEKEEKSSSGNVLKTLLLVAFLGTTSKSLLAQTTEVAVSSAHTSYWGLNAFTFYFMLTIIAFELYVAYVLYRTSMQLLGVSERKEREAAERAAAGIVEPTLMEKLNASVAIEKESEILMDHNYDGIMELDNNLPPWWKYGFYVTIVFAVIYIINFHITKTGKLQKAEYDEQMQIAAADAEAYRKKAANLVDENNATTLTDASSLESGKTIFMDNCAACHGKGGQGGVGPNLTDDYWLHGGSIKDIFRTVKLGWPDKGMKAWQLDLSSRQIHEVSSYVKSLHGTNPENPKEKQGDLYQEGGAPVDSTNTSAAIDTVQVAENK